MIAIDYLNGIMNLEASIERRRDELERIESIVYNVTANLTPRESCSVPQPVERTSLNIVRYMEAKDALEESIIECIDRRQECMEYLDELDNPVFADVLYKRYLESKSWDIIAKELCYSYHHVHRLHSSALVKFQEILDTK